MLLKSVLIKSMMDGCLRVDVFNERLSHSIFYVIPWLDHGNLFFMLSYGLTIGSRKFELFWILRTSRSMTKELRHPRLSPG